jgi:hypothetical protein
MIAIATQQNSPVKSRLGSPRDMVPGNSSLPTIQPHGQPPNRHPQIDRRTPSHGLSQRISSDLSRSPHQPGTPPPFPGSYTPGSAPFGRGNFTGRARDGPRGNHAHAQSVRHPTAGGGPPFIGRRGPTIRGPRGGGLGRNNTGPRIPAGMVGTMNSSLTLGEANVLIESASPS